MIIYGARATNIGNFTVPGTKCDYCEQTNSQHISVFGRYAHVFWIPLFPIGRTAVAECNHCKKTIEKKEFSPSLKELYDLNKATVRRPYWHWAGLGIIGFLFLVTSLIGLTAEEDPRDILLDQDVEAMVFSPTMESDSISYKIKQLFEAFSSEEINTNNFEYLTKVKEDKALVLVKIPDLKKVAKEARLEALEMIEMITDTQADLEGKDMYIGVHGKYNMMLVKTPTDEQNSSIALTGSLNDFYGPKPKNEE